MKKFVKKKKMSIKDKIGLISKMKKKTIPFNKSIT